MGLINKIVFGGGIVFDLTKWAILLVVVLAVINTFFIGIFVVDGPSMETTLHDKEVVLWGRNSFSSKEPTRGEIVMVNYPGDPVHKKYVKRIVGLPGEKVEVKNGKVYINDKLIREDYLDSSVESTPDGLWQIEKGRYFIMGDNRPNSNDSRFFGPVEKEFILGRALAVVFPRFTVPESNSKIQNPT